MVLLDTDILIECLRGSEAAKDWLGALGNAPFCVTGVVAMELVVGCRNQSELQRIQKFLQVFAIVWPEAAEFDSAIVCL